MYMLKFWDIVFCCFVISVDLVPSTGCLECFFISSRCYQ